MRTATVTTFVLGLLILALIALVAFTPAGWGMDQGMALGMPWGWGISRGLGFLATLVFWAAFWGAVIAGVALLIRAALGASKPPSSV